MDIDNNVIELKNMNIINDWQLNRLLALYYYTDAYKYIKRIVGQSSYAKSSYEFNRQSINTLFIYYLKDKYFKEPDSHLFEKVLSEMINILDLEVVEYLFSQDIDMNFYAKDRLGNEGRLINTLAMSISVPEMMNVFLDKINTIDEMYFYHDGYKSYTDLCIMNIISGNIIEALEIFDRNDYNLFMGVSNYELITDTLNIDNPEITMYGYNIKNHDNISKIISTINSYYLTINRNIKLLLVGILYSKKIKLFNIENLDLIKGMLSEEQYDIYIGYLSHMIRSNKITLFSVDDDKNTINYEPLDSIYNKGKTKVLKPNNN